MIEIVKAPPFATVQDLGRTRLRAQGVPFSGAMDLEATVFANLLAGNAEGAAVIEWALGEGRIRLTDTRTFSVFGATVEWNYSLLTPGMTLVAEAGEEITLHVPERRFAYIAFGGGIDVPELLGSRSTYLPGGFGGHEGRRLKNGDRLPLGPPVTRFNTGWADAMAEFLPRTDGPVRLVPGPQVDLFDPGEFDRLFAGKLAVGRGSDRMGYRLEGQEFSHNAPAALPSEPVCVGAVQVPQGGAPIVLMPDGPTVGGYPKIASIITTDLGRFAQLQPAARPDFELVTFEEAIAALRDREARFREGARVVRNP
ncbi:MAG TPA: biotin-dependent carboxyltransferase family protein [Gemmatimonadales bacterium]|nr:biotin-dependent carboxyltransferase family protein [Gemmatimonadales bacterium]